jgi:hypothetical protein
MVFLLGFAGSYFFARLSKEIARVIVDLRKLEQPTKDKKDDKLDVKALLEQKINEKTVVKTPEELYQEK